MHTCECLFRKWLVLLRSAVFIAKCHCAMESVRALVHLCSNLYISQTSAALSGLAPLTVMPTGLPCSIMLSGAVMSGL